MGKKPPETSCQERQRTTYVNSVEKSRHMETIMTLAVACLLAVYGKSEDSSEAEGDS